VCALSVIYFSNNIVPSARRGPDKLGEVAIVDGVYNALSRERREEENEIE